MKLFILAWFIGLIFILGVFYYLFSNAAKRYFKVPIEEVKPLLESSLKSFWVNFIMINSKHDKFLDEYSKYFKANIPFVFKIYFLPDCVVLTMLNKHAAVFRRNEWQFSKNGIFSYFTIENDTAKYRIETGFRTKFLKEWLSMT